MKLFKEFYTTDRYNAKSVLAIDTNIEGELRFNESTKINGKFKGKITSKGFLIIGEDAEISGNIFADTVIIGGLVKGDVEAIKRIEMLPTCRIYGNIKTSKLSIADGVIFEGNCEMTSVQT